MNLGIQDQLSDVIHINIDAATREIASSIINLMAENTSSAHQHDGEEQVYTMPLSLEASSKIGRHVKPAA